jgi:hypothetical protein
MEVCIINVNRIITHFGKAELTGKMKAKAKECAHYAKKKKRGNLMLELN